MGLSLFLGCLLTALGPVSVVFLLVVAPHANLVVLTILRCIAFCRALLVVWAAANDSMEPCAVQRVLLGVLDVRSVAGVASSACFAPEPIFFPFARRRLPGTEITLLPSVFRLLQADQTRAGRAGDIPIRLLCGLQSSRATSRYVCRRCPRSRAD
jgi:hypothetical protein